MCDLPGDAHPLHVYPLHTQPKPPSSRSPAADSPATLCVSLRPLTVRFHPAVPVTQTAAATLARRCPPPTASPRALRPQAQRCSQTHARLYSVSIATAASSLCAAAPPAAASKLDTSHSLAALPRRPQRPHHPRRTPAPQRPRRLPRHRRLPRPHRWKGNLGSPGGNCGSPRGAAAAVGPGRRTVHRWVREGFRANGGSPQHICIFVAETPEVPRLAGSGVGPRRGGGRLRVPAMGARAGAGCKAGGASSAPLGYLHAPLLLAAGLQHAATAGVATTGGGACGE